MATSASGASATRVNNRLTRIVLLLAWTAAAGWGAAPFSHRIHLALKLECLTCHPAAARSTEAGENLLPRREVCLDCHEDPVIPLPQPVGIASFSHALHLKMGDVAPFIAQAIQHKTYLQPAGDIGAHLNTRNPCEACHRGMEASDRIGPANMPQMADCLVCHSRIDPPFSCEDCHARDTHLKPASHVERFISLHSSGKLQFDRIACAVCHGRTFQCMGCH